MLPSIVIVGVECTGKTRLSQNLARRLERPLVTEQARLWLAERANRYVEADLLTLAELQWRAEHLLRQKGEAPVVDTDLVVIRIWSEVRFGGCHPRIMELLASRPPAVYLLPRPDLPWQADPQRESPDPEERAALHLRYRSLLKALGHSFFEIGGTGPAREQAALDALSTHPLLEGEWRRRGMPEPPAQ